MNILKKVPGFRSNKKKNKIIASTYYGFMLLSLIAVYPDISSIFMIISFILAPFVFFETINVVKNKGNYSKKRKGKLISSVLAMFISFTVSVATCQPTDENLNVNSSTTETNNSNTDSNKEKEETNIKDKDDKDSDSNKISSNVVQENLEENNNSEVIKVSEAEIHFIDTGNSDSILIKQGGENALIDAGDNNDEELVVSYLRNHGVSKLKYVYSTHPDADHCGGLDAVLDNIEVENVFVANGSADTKTYRDFINSVANKGLRPGVPLLGSEHKLGTSVLKVVSVANTNDVNNNSIVLLYTNGNDKLLFMGDAGKEIESNINVGDVDLIKIGHHGSDTSTSASFIDRISPEYAVILTGKNNKYGHPYESVMSLLQSRKIKVHRTDECGTIVFKSSGNGLSVDCKEGSYSSGSKSTGSSSSKPSTNTNTSKPSTNTNTNTNTTTNTNTGNTISNSNVVYWTASGKKYHSSPSCSNMKNPMSGTIAESGRTPCSKCY